LYDYTDVTINSLTSDKQQGPFTDMYLCKKALRIHSYDILLVFILTIWLRADHHAVPQLYQNTHRHTHGLLCVPTHNSTT